MNGGAKQTTVHNDYHTVLSNLEAQMVEVGLEVVHTTWQTDRVMTVENRLNHNEEKRREVKKRKTKWRGKRQRTVLTVYIYILGTAVASDWSTDVAVPFLWLSIMIR